MVDVVGGTVVVVDDGAAVADVVVVVGAVAAVAFGAEPSRARTAASHPRSGDGERVVVARRESATVGGVGGAVVTVSPRTWTPIVVVDASSCVVTRADS